MVFSQENTMKIDAVVHILVLYRLLLFTLQKYTVSVGWQANLRGAFSYL